MTTPIYDSLRPTFAPVDEPTADLLTLVANTHSPVGHDAVDAFLTACEADADAHSGEVSVNRVGSALAVAGIEHHRYSALWSHFTGRDRPMRKADSRDPRQWETRCGSTSRNDGKPMKLRRWVG